MCVGHTHVEFKLAKPVKNAYFRVRLRDGTRVEDAAREACLPAGGFRFNTGLHHLYPADTKFVARLETEDGKLLAEQAVAEEWFRGSCVAQETRVRIGCASQVRA